MNILYPYSRQDFREWLTNNAAIEKEVWVLCSRSKTPLYIDGYEVVRYIDVVEEALCFGWIDSTVRKNPEGPGCLQRFSPRRKHSHWTELNIERCHQLIKRGLMTPAGLNILPQ